jgi:hypothetical protein
VSNFLKYFYKIPISFLVNGEHILLPEHNQEELQHWFKVTVGKTRQPAGLGFLVKSGTEQGWLQKLLGQSAVISSLPSGLWISTFGKVIKGGWEWLGVVPKNAQDLSGLVEIPGLAEVLTTSKSDFLSDANSLKKYYKFRKAVQEAVLPLLQSLGEMAQGSHESPEKILKPLNKSITGALTRLVSDFPELESLLGQNRIEVAGRVKKEKLEREIVGGESSPVYRGEQESTVQSAPNTSSQSKNLNPLGVADESKSRMVRAKNAGLIVVLSDISHSGDLPLGNIIEDTLTVNTAHPAWKKAKQKGMEEYHIILTVGSVLSRFLESEKDPQEFLNSFLMAWAQEGQLEDEGKLF